MKFPTFKQLVSKYTYILKGITVKQMAPNSANAYLQLQNPSIFGPGYYIHEIQISLISIDGDWKILFAINDDTDNPSYQQKRIENDPPEVGILF